MKTTDKQKMCSNCHGRIPVEAETCLYCGQEQINTPEADQAAQTTLFEQQSLQESLTSLYSPPYASKRTSPFPEKSPQTILKQTSFKERQQPPKAIFPEESAPEAQNEGMSDKKGTLWSLALLLLGGNLFVLGLMQVFFSSGNRLSLEWQSESWYFYCLAAVPLLFVGYRLAGKLK